MTKKKFEEVIINWLKKSLSGKYGVDYNIEIIKPTTNISKLSNTKIKKISGYTSYEFKPDILVILEDKRQNNQVRLIIVNRTLNSISLKEIGEINLYSRITNPLEAFIFTLKGLPEEVNLILLNNELEKNLLEYNDGKYIYLIRWDIENQKIDKKAIYPSRFKNTVS